MTWDDIYRGTYLYVFVIEREQSKIVRGQQPDGFNVIFNFHNFFCVYFVLFGNDSLNDHTLLF